MTRTDAIQLAREAAQMLKDNAEWQELYRAAESLVDAEWPQDSEKGIGYGFAVQRHAQESWKSAHGGKPYNPHSLNERYYEFAEALTTLAEPLEVAP
jgi:hypothetical protein